MTDIDKQKFTQMLTKMGYSPSQIFIIIKEYDQKAYTFDQLVDDFVKRIDADPHTITNRNCESGKCNA